VLADGGGAPLGLGTDTGRLTEIVETTRDGVGVPPDKAVKADVMTIDGDRAPLDIRSEAEVTIKIVDTDMEGEKLPPNTSLELAGGEDPGVA
jgi:hypothetical protein